MSIPLYKGNNAPVKWNKNFNAGLWYDKFCNQWPGNWSLDTGQENAGSKLNWVKTVCDGKIGDEDLLKDMIERVTLMTLELGGLVRVFQTQWRFVTGLGRSHPVENGFTWHSTLGTPYLPGSSVKGLTLNMAKWLNDSDIEGVFGTQEKAGSIIFLDALSLRPVQLEADIMTPHYAEYYQGDGKPPADWYSPIPIPFLTVAAGQSFLFPIVPRRKDSKPGELEIVAGWLENALTFAGAGAKTSGGYGRFNRDTKEESRLISLRKEKIAQQEHTLKQKALAEMSPIRREMEGFGYSTDPDKFMKVLTEVFLVRLDEVTQDDSRIEIAKLLADWYKTNKPDQWKKPKGKNEDKVNKIKAVLQNNK